jgi:hypothetical protein
MPHSTKSRSRGQCASVWCRRCRRLVAVLDAYIELVASRLVVLEVDSGAERGCELGSGLKATLLVPICSERDEEISLVILTAIIRVMVI